MDDVSRYIRNVSTPMLVSMGAVAAATTYYLATRPKALPPVCDLRMQSVEVSVSLRAKSVCQSEVKGCRLKYLDLNTKAKLTRLNCADLGMINYSIQNYAVADKIPSNPNLMETDGAIELKQDSPVSHSVPLMIILA